MISSKEDFRAYLHQDRQALQRSRKGLKGFLADVLDPDYIWKFQKMLRRTEFARNCNTGFWGQLYYYILLRRFKKYSMKLGFTIPLNVFGPGLAIVHYGTIIINANAKIGKNCRLHAGTNIGASGGSKEAPVIGDNVYIGPGAKIYGNIRLANNIAIAANAAVNKDFTEENILIGGIPAVKIKFFDVSRVIKHLDP
jgi:serine O-acetyltransferase